MKLTDSRIKSFRAVKAFNEHKNRVNNLNFFNNGNYLISSGDDDQIIIYDSVIGTFTRSLQSKKYGCTLIQFTHSNTQAIHGSNKVDDAIRYLSLHDNKYLRYFQGHTKRVVSLHLSPLDDHFISGSLDQTIRLWDLKSPNCQGLLKTNGRPVAAFDPEGLIFAAGVNSEFVKLYDLRTYDKGPFVSFHVPSDRSSSTSSTPSNDASNPGGNAPSGTSPSPGSAEWTKILFSPNGQYILLCSNGPNLRLIDGYKGNVIHTFQVVSNQLAQMPLDASFTPDSAYVMSSAPDGRVYCWNVATGQRVVVFSPPQGQQDTAKPKPIGCVAFNTKYSLMTTASSTVTFWLPNVDELE